ncbi:Hypothetical predicted protein, partial [Pelobates cultripes]
MATLPLAAPPPDQMKRLLRPGPQPSTPAPRCGLYAWLPHSDPWPSRPVQHSGSW